MPSKGISSIIGEALHRLMRIDRIVVQERGDFPQMIAFRNIVVHGDDVIDDAIVWGIIQNELLRLLGAARAAIDKRT